jgi:hypothetical protein
MAYKTKALTESQLLEYFSVPLVTAMKEYFTKNPKKTVYKVRTNKKQTYVFRKYGNQYHVNSK